MSYPVTPTFDQITAHRLNPVKGWPGLNVVDVALEADDGENIIPGRVCHQKDNGKVGLGCPVGKVPLFCVYTGNRIGVDHDAARDMGGFASQFTVGTNGAEAGGAKCGFINGTQPFEAQTTELVTGLSSAGILPNVELSCDATGKIKIAASTEAVIAVVGTRGGIFKDAHRNDVVQLLSIDGPAKAKA